MKDLFIPSSDPTQSTASVNAMQDHIPQFSVMTFSCKLTSVQKGIGPYMVKECEGCSYQQHQGQLGSTIDGCQIEMND